MASEKKNAFGEKRENVRGGEGEMFPVRKEEGSLGKVRSEKKSASGTKASKGCLYANVECRRRGKCLTGKRRSLMAKREGNPRTLC